MGLPVNGIPIKTEICESISIKLEMMDIHGATYGMLDADQYELVQDINTIHAVLVGAINEMENNKHQESLLTASKTFKRSLDDLWRKIKDFESSLAKSGIPPDDTDQDATAICSLAWYRAYIGMIKKQKALLAAETYAKVLYSGDVTLQFSQSIRFLDKFRQRAKKRFPNAE